MAAHIERCCSVNIAMFLHGKPAQLTAAWGLTLQPVAPVKLPCRQVTLPDQCRGSERVSSIWIRRFLSFWLMLRWYM